MSDGSAVKARPRTDCALVVGGRFHDMGYARLELLKLLSDRPHIKTRVLDDYENIEAICSAHILISYTCDVSPSPIAQKAIHDWVQNGGRWYALHGTNSILRFTSESKVDCPSIAPIFMNTLGSRFLAHPPINPYEVIVNAPEHPLLEGIESFSTDDELYLMEIRDDLEVLLHTEFEGEAPGFVAHSWAKARHPVFYIRRLGDGEVLYLTLGHCRGHYDMQPRLDWWPSIDRGSWDMPVFRLLLERGIDYLGHIPGSIAQ